MVYGRFHVGGVACHAHDILLDSLCMMEVSYIPQSISRLQSASSGSNTVALVPHPELAVQQSALADWCAVII